MAKKSVIQRNIKRKKLVNRYAKKSAALKLLCKDPTISPEERFNNFMKLASLPRNSSATRVRLRCEVSGRGRGNYRKFRLSRIALRELASAGQIPGMVKSSW